jgi:hypothetical protein
VDQDRQALLSQLQSSGFDIANITDAVPTSVLAEIARFISGGGDPALKDQAAMNSAKSFYAKHSDGFRRTRLTEKDFLQGYKLAREQDESLTVEKFASASAR